MVDGELKGSWLLCSVLRCNPDLSYRAGQLNVAGLPAAKTNQIKPKLL
jgi:hypothetical protein